MFALLLLQFFKAFVFTNQFKMDIWSANSRSEALLLWEVISTSKALREQAKGWPCWDPGLRLAFLTLLFCCCGSCKAFRCSGFGQSWVSNQCCSWSSPASECLCDDKQRTSTKHCCLQTSSGHHAGTGNSCCLSGKGITCTKAWVLSLLCFVLQHNFPKEKPVKNHIEILSLRANLFSLTNGLGLFALGLFS